MKINLDFAKLQSLGNVNDKSTVNNFKEVEAAKKMCAANRNKLMNSINETLESGAGEIVNGTTMTIPTGHYDDSGFIHNLTFTVDSVSSDGANLSLTKISHKAN